MGAVLRLQLKNQIKQRWNNRKQKQKRNEGKQKGKQARHHFTRLGGGWGRKKYGSPVSNDTTFFSWKQTKANTLFLEFLPRQSALIASRLLFMGHERIYERHVSLSSDFCVPRQCCNQGVCILFVAADAN